MTKVSLGQASSTFCEFAGGQRQGLIIRPDTGCITWATSVLVPCVAPLDCRFHDIGDFHHPREPPGPSLEPGTARVPCGYRTHRW